MGLTFVDQCTLFRTEVMAADKNAHSLAGFKEVQLFKKDVIGIGSYGSVCRAKCDQLPCAAKILHPTLIIEHPGEKSPQARFVTECEFLSSLRHPNVVQYLGTWQDKDTDLPVLLMELMDGSLTQFLEKHQQGPLPFHTQVNICHDVALALSFLHSNDIIHRDLSSNNVLMIGDRRAKVTDFGMARLIDLNRKATRISFSMCPGTDVYMPPEAVREKPAYTEKIDCFAFGVLMLQTLSRKFPSPGNRVKSVIVGGRELLEPQSEFSRREEDIKIVDTTNPLLPLACECLRDKETERPSSKELCESIARLKQDKRYSSTEQRDSKDETGCDTREDSLRSELEQLKLAIAERDVTIQSLENTVEDRNLQIESLEERLNSSQKQNIDLLKGTLQGASAEATPTLTEGRDGETTPTPDGSLEWRWASDAPVKMTRCSDAVVCGDFVYVRPSEGRQLLQYSWTADTWTELCKCPTALSSLANVKNSLVVIGGYDERGDKTNKLYNLSIANQHFTWLETYPPMPSKRDSAMAACYGGYLIVAGGIGTSYLKTVEVLLTAHEQWYVAASLPSEMFSGSAVICGDMLYVLGGLSAVGTITYSVMNCPLGALVDSCVDASSQAEGVWSCGAVLPVGKPTCVTFRNQLLAICGQDKLHYDLSRKIWVYKDESWEVLMECQQARSQCLAAVLPGNQLLVTGGFTARNMSGETCSTEVGRVTTQSD